MKRTYATYRESVDTEECDMYSQTGAAGALPNIFSAGLEEYLININESFKEGIKELTHQTAHKQSITKELKTRD